MPKNPPDARALVGPDAGPEGASGTAAQNGVLPAPENSFPVVGIGASAGGLEALEQFLRHVATPSSACFVIVQHLDPTKQGMLTELLQRVTEMRVAQASDGVKLRPNSVYVIPPNANMSVLHGVLHLFVPTEPRGQRLPIDFFFRSLAEDLKERSIGVVLSGTGSDGTLGLAAIKETAGTAFVQDPASAKFDGMPSHAIDAGLADVVAPADEIPGRILAFLQHAPYVVEQRRLLTDSGQGALDKIVILLRSKTGNDFSQYKKSTLERRIERRMGLQQIDKVATYVRFLQENPQEVELLHKELLIGVTGFFRDPEAWKILGERALPALIAGRSAGQALRAWTPGCSTGEEAYSLAMEFKTALERMGSPSSVSLQIFGTDVDNDAIDRARKGFFSANIVADVSPERLDRFFAREGQGFRVKREIREMVVFAPQNVTMDPPFTRLDVVVCRNLLIYLIPEVQRRLLSLFHYSLKPGGVLFLGSAEALGRASGLFTVLDRKGRIYRRAESQDVVRPDFTSQVSASPLEAPSGAGQIVPVSSLQAMADNVLLQRFSPAAVLVNREGDILYVSGRTGKYLEPAAGKANWNVIAMAREGLRHQLDIALERAFRHGEGVALGGLLVQADGVEQRVDLTVHPLEEPGALHGLAMVVFADAPASPVVARESHALGAVVGDGDQQSESMLEEELFRVREALLAMREEMQASQEELRSANEELQSSNEELQSANEELTTSKEELQSMNEELQTVNAELQAKLDELAHASNDMKNLLDSTDIATLFLDRSLKVRRFTAQASKLIRLIPVDVGRPISDLVSDLQYPELIEDSRSVLLDAVALERQVATADGRWFTVRVMPYRTLDNVIDGVVMTFLEVTASKATEEGLRAEGRELSRRLGNEGRDSKTPS